MYNDRDRGQRYIRIAILSKTMGMGWMAVMDGRYKRVLRMIIEVLIMKH